MRKYFQQIQQNIEKVDFQLIWKGFQPSDFALYTSKIVWLKDKEIAWDDRFNGNTAILYEGKYIAIWNMEQELNRNSKVDLDLLTVGLIHEMFHVFQFSHEEQRFPKDLTALQYPWNQTNYELKFEENKLITKAIYSDHKEEKRTLLNQICGIRSMRFKIIGEEMTECETYAETTEGMAVYAQLCALKQLDHEKYLQQCKKNANYITSVGDWQFDVRNIAYFSGAFLLMAAKEAEIDIYHNISNRTDSAYSILKNQLKPEIMEFNTEPSIKTAMENAKSIREEEIAKAKQELKYKVEGSFYISGYDPMNMIRFEDEVLCKRFVRISNINTNEGKMIFGQALLKMDTHSPNCLHSYYVSSLK